MCFRPSQVSLPVKCDECGTINDAGITVCAKCGKDLTGAIAAAADRFPAPSAPGAPKAPAAPNAPTAQKTPPTQSEDNAR